MNRRQRRARGIKTQSVREYVERNPKAPVKRGEIVPLLDGFMREWEDRRRPWRRIFRGTVRVLTLVPGVRWLIAKYLRWSAEGD